MTKIIKTLLVTILLATTIFPASAASHIVSTLVLPAVSMASNGKLNGLGLSLQSKKQQRCLGLAIYHEARGEPVVGQHAVAITIMNRVRSSAYPNTICKVVFQNEHLFNRCQFSFACDGKSDRPKNAKAMKKSMRVARMTLNGNLAREAEFMGADYARKLESFTHYHRIDIRPAWSPRLERLVKVGTHLFLKSERVTSRYQVGL